MGGNPHRRIHQLFFSTIGYTVLDGYLSFGIHANLQKPGFLCQLEVTPSLSIAVLCRP